MFIAKTDGNIRRKEFTYMEDTEEFTTIFSELNGKYPQPSVIGKEDTLYSLYFTEAPEGFPTDGMLYALKIDTSTGVDSKKVYYRGNTSGLVVDYEVIATGEFLDSPGSYTLYHGDGVTFEEAITMAKPYSGSTYTDGDLVRFTEYSRV